MSERPFPDGFYDGVRRQRAVERRLRRVLGSLDRAGLDGVAARAEHGCDVAVVDVQERVASVEEDGALSGTDPHGRPA